MWWLKTKIAILELIRDLNSPDLDKDKVFGWCVFIGILQVFICLLWYGMHFIPSILFAIAVGPFIMIPEAFIFGFLLTRIPYENMLFKNLFIYCHSTIASAKPKASLALYNSICQDPETKPYEKFNYLFQHLAVLGLDLQCKLNGTYITFGNLGRTHLLLVDNRHNHAIFKDANYRLQDYIKCGLSVGGESASVKLL